MTTSEYNNCVGQYADSLYRFIFKQLRREADAKDIVQITYEKLWIHHENVDFMKAKSYLFKTGYSSMIDGIRKMKRMDFVEVLPERSTNTIAKAYEDKELVEKAVAQLNEIQKSVLMLRDYEGYSYEEIGEITNLSESQVKVYIFRARKKMQEMLGGVLNFEC
jgi:RNA polymerase sigma factor (sigma-70 family)